MWTSPPGSEVGAATLAGDGYVEVEQDNGALGTTYTTEYREIASGATYFSESAWNALTGQAVDLAPGTCANVLDDEGGSELPLRRRRDPGHQHGHR